MIVPKKDFGWQATVTQVAFAKEIPNSTKFATNLEVIAIKLIKCRLQV
jgi:hypothetical protein